MKKILTLFTIGFIGSSVMHGQSIVKIQENFDNVPAMFTSGWSRINLSSPVGSSQWAQSVNGVIGTSVNGSTTSHIEVNYLSTTGANTISNWLISPQMSLDNGDTISFYTISYNSATYPDRLECRLSTTGASPGSTSTSVGDFTTLVLSVNPNLTFTGYPSVQISGNTWTKYSGVVTGLSGTTQGYIALRYFVTNGGPDGANSSSIAVDAFKVNSMDCSLLGIASSVPNGTAGTAYNQALNQTVGVTPNFSVTSGSLPPGITLSAGGVLSGTPTAVGQYTFTVTEGPVACNKTQAYTLEVNCPANPINITPFAAVCSNDASFALSGATPSGGTYSGTGVTGGNFDPSAGTQTITYNYTDAYGCAHTSSETITVNAVPATPTITPSGATTFCTGGSVTLSSSAATGNVWSPGAETTQDIVVQTGGSYTVSVVENGCQSSASAPITVTISPSPTASFTVNNTGNAYTFTNTSTNQTSVSWDFGDGSPASTDNSPTHTYTSNGTYTVTLSATNSCGTSTSTQSITISGISINESDVFGKINVYPNPANEGVSISVSLTETKDITFKVFDMSGKLLINEYVGSVNGAYTKWLDISTLAKGAYQLLLETNDSKVVRKIIKQ